MIKDKLTDLCGNSLLQKKLIDTFYEIRYHPRKQESEAEVMSEPRRSAASIGPASGKNTCHARV